MRLKTFRERAMQGVFFLTALASIASVAIICVFLFINGVPAMAAAAGLLLSGVYPPGQTKVKGFAV